MDEKQPSWIQDRLIRLDPESDEFKRLLLEVAEGSDHPNDVVIARILRRELPPRLVIEAATGLCTHNYAFFERKPCPRPAVALIWRDSLAPWLGTKVCDLHLIGAVQAARLQGVPVVGRR